MRLIKGSLAGLVLAGILAMMPAAGFAHGGWWVTHLADSPAVALVRD
jgi:hypothetical protein